MFTVDEEFFDLELDDDFFRDAFNVTSKSSTQQPPNVNSVVLLKQSNPEHVKEPGNNLQEVIQTEAENQFNEVSVCASDGALKECEVSLPTEELGKKGQPSNGTNNAKQLPSPSYYDFQLQRISSDSENGLSSDPLGLRPKTDAKSGLSLDGEKDSGSKSGLLKDVKTGIQKRLPFMSCEDQDFNSIFSFESVDECITVSESAEDCDNRTLAGVKPKSAGSRKFGQQKRPPVTKQASSTSVKFTPPSLRDRPLLNTPSECTSNLVLQSTHPNPDSASSALLTVSTVGVVNKQSDRQVLIQKTSSHFSDASTRVKNSGLLNQSTPKNKLNSLTRKRKFPGPAGILPELPPGADLSTLSEPESPIVRVSPKDAAPQDFVCSQSFVDEFEKRPWQMMLKDLASDGSTASVIDKFNISWVLERASSKQLPKGKVPVLCMILKSISFQGSEARVTFADKTGEMNGMIHGKLLEEYQEKLQPGAVLVLKQATVFSPSSRNHYLLITPSNIISLYGVPGDKTSVVSCSGSQLIAMAERSMQEVTSIPRATIRSRQFSLNSPDLGREMSFHSSAQNRNDFLPEQVISDRPAPFQARVTASSHGCPQTDKIVAKTSTNLTVIESPNTLNWSPCAGSSTENEIASEVAKCNAVVDLERTIDSNVPDCTEHQLLISGTAVSKNSCEGESAAFEDDFDDLFLSLDEEALLIDKW